MAEFLGARISLISKSDIRYSGTLHEINSEESTVALENVRSFGTEGRRGKPDEEVGASDQVYEYIVFRGSDVKDLRIEQAPTAKEEQPPMPNDPAILGARPRPAPGQAPPPFMGGPPGPFGPNMHMPPPNWGPPGPGSPHRGFPHQPPPGWMPPHGFPPGPGGPFGPGGPGGPGPGWGNQFYGPGAPGAPGGPGFQQQNRQQPPQTPENRPAPIGAAGDKQRQMQPLELPDEPQQPGQAGPSQGKPPAPPIESKPTVEEVKATAAALAMNGPGPSAARAQAPIPTGPRVTKITPAVPLPTALTNKAQQPAKQANAQSAAVSQAAIKDATDAARAAVTAAMAKLDPSAAGPLQAQQAQQSNGGNAMDNLTRKVNEMRVNATRPDTHSSRGGRGRGGAHRPAKVEVPKDDFDFGAANAKFNKGDIVKEAIAGSPLGEAPDASHDETPEASDAIPPPAYSKTRSFFDNISSEAKDRADNGGQKPGGREWRGVEQRKNMETFGQGSVDGGHRGYRGRGRGRGRGGRGRGRGGYRGDGQNAAIN